MQPQLDTSLHPPLRAYLSLLEQWNRIHALTALPPGDRWEELILDSAALLPHLAFLSPGARLGDFGTGMGMPALLIALARPDLTVLALDKSKKKCAFVRQAGLELGLKNLQVLHGRFEHISPLGLDMGVAKALGSVPALQAWWDRHGLSGAPFLALKGPQSAGNPSPSGWLYLEHSYELPRRGARQVLEMKRGPEGPLD